MAELPRERVGVRVASSQSLTLFAGSGMPIAALNIYARETGALDELAAHAVATYEPTLTNPRPRALDPRSAQLIDGLARALELRDVIQQAIGVLMASQRWSATGAYAALRAAAADQEQPLLASRRP